MSEDSELRPSLPNWSKLLCFDLDHGVVNGSHMVTRHNGLWCKSCLLIDGKVEKVWQVINPINDVLTIARGDDIVTINYRFFLSIRVNIRVNDGDVHSEGFREQTKKLYQIGLYIALVAILAVGLLSAFAVAIDKVRVAFT